MMSSSRGADIRAGVFLATQDDRARAERDRYEHQTLSLRGREIYQAIQCTWPLDLIQQEVARAVDA